MTDCVLLFRYRARLAKEPPALPKPSPALLTWSPNALMFARPPQPAPPLPPRQQLDVLPADLHKAQCVGHQILLGKVVPVAPGAKHRIGGITDSASHTLPRCTATGNQ
jgi:hypothetical protein